MRTLKCRFHPQVWIRDYATDIDPEGDTDFAVAWPDDTPLPTAFARDDLIHSPGAPEWMRAHASHHPFYVEILEERP